MRKILLSTIAIAALTGSALAADLPSRKAAPSYIEPAPVFSWTGFYAGIEGGGDFRQFSGGGNKVNASGGLLGGVVGYNYQVNQFVLGLEGDAAGLIGDSKTFAAGANKAQSGYEAAIRGRGGLAFDRALLFVAGGVAFSNTQLSIPPNAINDGRAGWTIGGGLDYAFTPNWIGRIEYRYVDLGYSTIGATRVTDRSNEVIAGLMYKFGAPQSSAVLAKY